MRSLDYKFRGKVKMKEVTLAYRRLIVRLFQITKMFNNNVMYKLLLLYVV